MKSDIMDVSFIHTNTIWCYHTSVASGNTGMINTYLDDLKKEFFLLY